MSQLKESGRTLPLKHEVIYEQLEQLDIAISNLELFVSKISNYDYTDPETCKESISPSLEEILNYMPDVIFKYNERIQACISVMHTKLFQEPQLPKIEIKGKNE